MSKIRQPASDDMRDAFRASLADPDRRVRIAKFGRSDKLRTALRVFEGKSRDEVSALHANIFRLRGTPQNPVDWTDPDRWIPERLSGPERELAWAIWTESERTLSPRYIRGYLQIADKYPLLDIDGSGAWQLTPMGRDFVDHPGGAVEREFDEQEGILQLLGIVADLGPAPLKDLVEPWGDFLERRSEYRTDSSIKETLRRRLRNLSERGFVERRGFLYEATREGLAYLGGANGPGGTPPDDDQQLRALIRAQTESVRAAHLELLVAMDPFDFEHLIKRLLEEMGYQDVTVTSPGGDGGVDVVGEIELGISTVREVVQAKRYRVDRAVSRKTLDALRGSLQRFDALRGTIITTARFARGATEEALRRGAAPITLIDGQRLVDLLIEHGIGVRKRAVELLELDPSEFDAEDE